MLPFSNMDDFEDKCVESCSLGGKLVGSMLVANSFADTADRDELESRIQHLAEKFKQYEISTAESKVLLRIGGHSSQADAIQEGFASVREDYHRTVDHLRAAAKKSETQLVTLPRRIGSPEAASSGQLPHPAAHTPIRAAPGSDVPPLTTPTSLPRLSLPRHGVPIVESAYGATPKLRASPIRSPRNRVPAAAVLREMETDSRQDLIFELRVPGHVSEMSPVERAEIRNRIRASLERYLRASELLAGWNQRNAAVAEANELNRKREELLRQVEFTLSTLRETIFSPEPDSRRHRRMGLDSSPSSDSSEPSPPRSRRIHPNFDGSPAHLVRRTGPADPFTLPRQPTVVDEPDVFRVGPVVGSDPFPYVNSKPHPGFDRSRPETSTRSPKTLRRVASGTGRGRSPDGEPEPRRFPPKLGWTSDAHPTTLTAPTRAHPPYKALVEEPEYKRSPRGSEHVKRELSSGRTRISFAPPRRPSPDSLLAPRNPNVHTHGSYRYEEDRRSTLGYPVYERHMDSRREYENESPRRSGGNEFQLSAGVERSHVRSGDRLGSGRDSHASRAQDWAPQLLVDASYSFHLQRDLMNGSGKPFDGDAEMFAPWRRHMALQLQDARCGPSKALHILSQNTAGPPRQIIEDLIYSDDDPETCLRRAWRLLEKRFGSPTLIAQSLVSRVQSFKQIPTIDKRDKGYPDTVNRMEKLLTLVQRVSANLHRYEELQILDSRWGMDLVAGKMPGNFFDKWVGEFTRYRRRHGVAPRLSFFVEKLRFRVEDLVERMCYYSPLALLGQDRIPHGGKAMVTKQDQAPAPTASLDPPAKTTPRRSAQESPSQYCEYHNSKQHSLENCNTFGNLELEGRKTFVKERGLCYRCLGQHFAKHCSFDRKCEICSGAHHPILHDGRSRTQAPAPSSNPAAPRNSCSQVCGTRGDQPRCCSKTVPILIRCVDDPSSVIRCYCIIDEQSNTTFCDPEVPQRLGVATTRESYTLATMSGLKNHVEASRVSGLEVRGVNESEWIPLPDTLTHPSIPDTRIEAATRNVVRAQPHLKHLAKHFPEIRESIPVLLLIGTNCGPAMFTKPVGSHFPFAHHTALGWSLVGPVCREGASADGGGTESSCYRMAVTNVGRTCEHFSSTACFPVSVSVDRMPKRFDPLQESAEDDLPGVSKDAAQFQNMVETRTVKNERRNLVIPLPLKSGSILPRNRGAVFRRSTNSLRRIEKNPSLAERCTETMQKYLDAGHVQQLEEGTPETPGRTYHIPVFIVVH